jgi:hypothetical protein
MPRLCGDIAGNRRAGVAESAAAAHPAPFISKYGCSSGHQQHFVVPRRIFPSIYASAGKPNLILPQRWAAKIMPRNRKFN